MFSIEYGCNSTNDNNNDNNLYEIEINSVDGIIQQDETILVHRTGFGVKHTLTNYDYFDE
ncbi:MAG: hypothetical protein SVZ03_05190 [Spirochaetota bacterium]|nr:hypothetical protein [Spirochaetota bacterium]